MGWRRDDKAQGSLSSGSSPVKENRRRMSAAKVANNDPQEWLNTHNLKCPLLRPVLEARTKPSKITIPKLTVTGHSFTHDIQENDQGTSPQAPAQRSLPISPGGRTLSLGGQVLVAPPQSTTAHLISDPNPDNIVVSFSGVSGSLEQIHLYTNRKSFFTPPTQPSIFNLTHPQQYSILPAQPAPNRPIAPYQACQIAMEQQRMPQNMILLAQSSPQPAMPSFLAAMTQQRELNACTPAVEATALNTRTYLPVRNREYEDYLINIQQLIKYAKNYQKSWYCMVELYIQRFWNPSKFQVAPHFWGKDAWKADMLEKNPGSVPIWPDPASGTIEHNVIEELCGSGLNCQAMEAAIVELSHTCQPREVINVMYRTGWTRRSEYIFGVNWTTMDTIKKMDEGPEKISLLAKAKTESPLFFKKCMQDEMCGRKRKLEHSLSTAQEFDIDQPNGRPRKWQTDEKRPFGSGRLMWKRAIRQRENPIVDEIVETMMSRIKKERKHAEWRNFIAAKDGTYVHRQPMQQNPTHVILHGYHPNDRDKAVAAYESISKGMTYEDYHRDPKRCRYPGVANPPRKRPLTAQERLLSRYQGGNCWIRVTFDTEEAAQHVVRQSPHRIGNHLVFAHMYGGLGPREDLSIPWQGNGTPSNQGCGCV